MNPDYKKTIDHSNYDILNKSNQLKFAPDFFKTADGKYTSLDPRLIDVMRGGYSMQLNVPVYDATWKSFNRGLGNKIGTQQYSSYTDIDGGQVSYYVDDYLTQPYFAPNYQIRSQIQPRVFIDPMGSLKPEYNRVPILQTASYISDYRFDQDQIGFREDIMSLQSRKRDQEDFSKFYGNYQLFLS
jgi:hypothetical protein